MPKYDLVSREKRKGLPRRSSPYWVGVAVGRGLGYRREPGSDFGHWFARLRVGGNSGSPYKWRALGEADDRPRIEADGKEILDYGQAFEEARKFNPFADAGDELPDDGELTVSWAMVMYMEWFEPRRGGVRQTCNVINGHINPQLGTLPLDRLTASAIRRWHQEIASHPRGWRTSKKKRGKRRKKREISDAEFTADQQRARKATANRILSVLKAACNRAFDELLYEKKLEPEFRDRLVLAQHALQGVKPFEKTDGKRTRYLDTDEAKRLANACDPDFRNIVTAALYSGARWSELTRLRVADMRFDVGGIYVAESKSGHPRTIFLNDQAITFFESITAGRDGDALMFTLADGRPWSGGLQSRRMSAACQTAQLKPRVVFHELRHTYASLYLMLGGGLPDLAKQLGHSGTRMVERHYGHLAESWRADRARQFAPTFDLEPTRKVRRIRARS